MSDMPDLDVVIATHNRPDMVREAVAAVLAQDYAGSIRCLVVHDRCPLDTTLEHQAPNRSVEVLPNNRRPGLAGSRNTGILAGAGELVGFCDDDDEWHPDKISSQVDLLQRSGADTVVSGIVIDYQDTTHARIPDPADLTVARLARKRVVAAHPSTVLVRRAALTGAIGLVDEDLPGSYAEDYDWILRAAGEGQIAVVERALVTVHWGASQFAQKWPTIVAAVDYLLAKHPAFSEDRRALGRLRGQRAFALAASRDDRAVRAVASTVRAWPLEPRAYLAAGVALRVVRAERVLAMANRHGRGI